MQVRLDPIRGNNSAPQINEKRPNHRSQMENRIMRPHLCLKTFILLTVLVACGDSRQPVVLVHMSDPHLLDPKQPGQEKLNQLAFGTLMDTLRKGIPGVPSPQILVVTGDFGIEVADPLFTRDTSGPPQPPDSVRASRRMDEVVNIVASEINGSPIRKVFFVPGNNDVFLEDADFSAWSEVDEFITRVQSKLRNRQIRDLTACYHRANSTPADCTARLDSPYVLVGFPTVSFKNAPLTQYQYLRFVQGQSGLPPGIGIAHRVYRQDTLHLEMLRRFRQALSEATAGGWRAIVVTHIPDLEDPFPVRNRTSQSASPGGTPASPANSVTGGRAPAAAPVPDSTPSPSAAVQQAAQVVQSPTRLSPPGRDDAWNASPAVFAEWKGLLEWPRVQGMLAGHFHDTTRTTYQRPYPWSDATASAQPGTRLDRCRIFVAPPLAEKNQDSATIGARGFALITLQNQEIGRQLYWYRKDSVRFEAGPAGDIADGRAGDLCRPEGAGPAARPQGFTLNPFRSSAHGATFALSFFAAPLMLLIWAAGEPTRSRIFQWLWARRFKLMETFPGAGSSRNRRLFSGGVVGGSNLLLVELIWDKWDLVLFALFWFMFLCNFWFLVSRLFRQRE